MQICTPYTLYIKIHSLFAYLPFLFSQSTTLTILFVLVNIMVLSTRRTKRRSSSSEDPDLGGPQRKKLKFRRSKGGATPSLIVKFPHSAKEHFAGPDAGATPSLIVTFPRSAEEHPARSHSTESPPAKAARGRLPRNKQKASLTVTFPCSAEEHPARSHSTESPPAKAPRGKPPRTKQKADQQNNSFSVDTRPKSWGMPEVWAEVFH